MRASHGAYFITIIMFHFTNKTEQKETTLWSLAHSHVHIRSYTLSCSH